MKLDERIDKLSDVLACVDAEDAKQFIGQTGYFADVIYGFTNLSDNAYSILDILDNVKGTDSPFHAQNENDSWRYFIPECRLKPKEKKIRPYTFVEFSSKFIAGGQVTFRPKDKPDNRKCFVLSGTFIYLGDDAYTLDELFNDYEWYDDNAGQWKPFGIEDSK